MNEQVKMYIEKYPAEIVDMFKTLRKLIYDSVSFDLVETLWAKLPSYKITPKGMLQLLCFGEITFNDGLIKYS